MVDPHPEPELRRLAHRLLLSQEGRGLPDSSPPTLEELLLLSDDRLDFDRRQQVYAWLNRDPALLRDWIAQVETRQATGVPDAPHSRAPWLRWTAWLSPGYGLGGGLAVAGLVMIMIGFSPDSLRPGLAQDLGRMKAYGVKSHAEGEPVAKSGVTVLPELDRLEKAGLLQGLEAGLALGAGTAALADESGMLEIVAGACPQAVSPPDCERVLDQAYDLGLWLALTDLMCARRDIPDTLWATQLARLQKLGQTEVGRITGGLDGASASQVCPDAGNLVRSLMAVTEEGE